MISSLVPALISAFKVHRELALENVALRQQLAVLRRSVKRPQLSNVDREFWVLLRRIWADWESVLLVQLKFMEGTGPSASLKALRAA